MTGMVPKRPKKGRGRSHSRKRGWRVGLGGDKPSVAERNPFKAELFASSKAGLEV